MIRFKYALGHNNQSGLQVLAIQPFCPGLGYAKYTNAVSRLKKGRGNLTTIWRYNILDYDQYDDIRAQFSLTDTILSQECTVRTMMNAQNAFFIQNAVIGYEPMKRGGKRKLAFWDVVEFQLDLLGDAT